jgi:hypothetical protein
MGSPVLLRRLSKELVKHRKRAGLTVEDAAKALDWSPGRITYMELVKWKSADYGNVERVLRLYDVPPEEMAALLDLARQTKEKAWWRVYDDVYGASPPLAGFEEASTLIRAHASAIVPGLFQTEDYARAIFTGGQVLAPTAIDRMVEFRLARQQILERETPPEIWAILDEAALLRLVGGAAVMAAQIRRLIELAAWPHITIQVVPNSVGAHAGLTGGRFMILDFAGDDQPLVFLEEASSSLFLETSEDVQAYTLMFSRITSAALGPEDSVVYLATLRDRINDLE